MTDGLNIFILPQSVYLNSETFYNINLSDDPEDIDDFMPDDSVWSCPGTDESAYNIISTISLNLTNTEAQELLSKLTHNDTGVKITWYEDITDCVYTVGLPHTVVSMIGVEAMENLTWGTSSSSSFFGRVIKWVEDAGDAAWNLISETVLLDDLIDAVSDWGFDVVNDIAEDLEDIKDMVLDGKDFLITWLKQQVENIVDPVLNDVKSQIGMEFIQGLGMSGLSTALSLADSGSSEKDIMTQAASPGFDAISTFFTPLIMVVGTASALIDNYASFIKEPVEEFLNDIVIEGVIDIVNLIMPLDEDTENMIRNATGGDVDPEIEDAAENMSNELNFTSKEDLIESVYDSCYNDTEEEDENESDVMQEFYENPFFKSISTTVKKIALLIGLGGEDVNMDDVPDISGSVKNTMGQLAELLKDRGYQFISPSPNGTDRFNYNVNKDFVDDKLFSWLKENLTEYNNTKVYIGIFAHGFDNNGGYFAFSDYDPDQNDHRYLWKNFSRKLDIETLDRNNDGIISNSERKKPLYGKMIIQIESCYSGLAINYLKENDTVKQRIVITSSDVGEKSWGVKNVGAIFTTHFTNFIRGIWWDEYKFSFMQNMAMILLVSFLGGSIIGFIIGIISHTIIASTGLGILVALAITIGIARIMAEITSCQSFLLGGSSSSIYTAKNFADIPALWGFGFHVRGANPQLYNEGLAYWTTL